MPNSAAAPPTNRIRRLGRALGIGGAVVLAVSGTAAAAGPTATKHHASPNKLHVTPAKVQRSPKKAGSPIKVRVSRPHGVAARLHPSTKHPSPTKKPGSLANKHPATASPQASPYEDPAPYYEASARGAVWPLAGARYYGQVNATADHTSVVDMALTPGDGGYWEVAANGRVWAFGSARYKGSPAHSHMHMRPAGLVPTNDGGGYWVFDRNGDVHAFGAATNYGSLAGRILFSPVIDLVPTPNDGGYWLITSRGRAAAYGNARHLGDLRHVTLTTAITGFATTPSGAGYWMVGASGQVWSFGAARNHGSLATDERIQPMSSIIATADGDGYWLIAHDGDIHSFGDAENGSPPEFAFVHTVSTAGDRAVEWALKQLGKPYIWGGTGPKGFDCSGLTMMSWKAAGVTIPRIAADQYIAGRKKPIRDLIDGDLIYWTSDPSNPNDIYHVAMYLGSGNVVAAPETGENVRTEPIWTVQMVSRGTAP
jgi:cell wall-associated NlpC family hydrolase